jgi:hypothetical protein
MRKEAFDTKAQVAALKIQLEEEKQKNANQ